jgi:hypothetical protein
MKTRPKTKRKPLLVDELLNNIDFAPTHPVERRRFHAMKDHLRAAKKFVLDEQAAIYAAEMIRDHPIAVAHDQEFAIPAFPNMYIELPYEKFFKTVNETDLDPDGDRTVGYYIDGPTAYVMSRAENLPLTEEAREKIPVTQSKTPMVMPIAYRLNRPFTVEEELDMCERMEISRIGMDVFFWGSVTPKVERNPEMFRALRANHSFEHWYGHDVADVLPIMFKSAAGDLRNIIALILFLNRTSDLRIEDEIGFHQTLIHAKPAVLTKHNVVRLKLDPKPMLKRIYGTGGSWRRRHDVRGHFCHDKTTREHNHEHDWREYDVNQWRCMNCGGKKWWRKACSRGSREKGSVETTYEVTK